MNDDSPAAQPRQLIDGQRATADLARIVRVTCIRRRDLTLDQLAAQSGVALPRLRKFLDGDEFTRREPRLGEALSIWAVLREAGANASLSAIGLTASDDDAPDETPARALAPIIIGSGQLAECAADGRVTIREVDDAEAGAALIERGVAMFRRLAKRARRG